MVVYCHQNGQNSNFFTNRMSQKHDAVTTPLLENSSFTFWEMGIYMLKKICLGQQIAARFLQLYGIYNSCLITLIACCSR